MKRKGIVLSVSAALAAMAFAGVAFSLTGTNARLGPTPEEVNELARVEPGTKEKTHASPRVDGETWGLRSYTNVRKEICLSHDVPGEAVGTGCISAARIFADGPLHVIRGARQKPVAYAKQEWDNQWVYGMAHPAVGTLTLVNMDCSTQELALDKDGAFNHTVNSEKIKNGEVPYKLIARGRDGAVLAEEVVTIGLTYHGKRAGLKVPQPKQACR